MPNHPVTRAASSSASTPAGAPPADFPLAAFRLAAALLAPGCVGAPAAAAGLPLAPRPLAAALLARRPLAGRYAGGRVQRLVHHAPLPRALPRVVDVGGTPGPGSCLSLRGLRRLAAGLGAVAWLAIAAALAGAGRAEAQPAVKSAIAGFTDVNGNGVLDCGEPVDLLATFATRNSNTPALTGQLIVGASGVAGLIFQAGSVSIDPDLTNGCTGTIVLGNNPGDSDARVDFSCPADPPDNNAWTLVVHYQERFDNSSPAFTAAAFAQTSDGATYQDTANGSAGGAVCGGGGVPAQIAVGKSAAGPATPGSTLLYTITATDQSGAGQGGLQLVEAVPAHTTFSAAGSSPGWVCTPGPGAGSVCRNPVGNVNPNATLTSFFAVTLDGVLPAAPVALPNTACVRLGPTVVAGCASLTTPAAGTPVLHLAKTLGGGSPQGAVPGATLSYALAAANTGNQDLADVVLQETVPAFTTFAAAASSAGWVCVPAAGGAGAACTLDLGPLAAGAAAVGRTFAVVVADPLPPLSPTYVFANTACLHAVTAGVGGGGAVADSCSTVGVPSAGTPMLQGAKTLRSGDGTPGTVLLYDLAVQNTGNEGAGVVDAAETVPAHTSFAAGASSPGWACVPASGAAGAACTLSVGSLLAGATVHVLFALTVDRPLAAGVTAVANTACFRFANLNEARAAGAAVNPACDTVTTPTNGHPLLTVEKSYAGAPAAAGALLAFQLVARNGGDQDAGAVTLTETVPLHTSFAAGGSSAAGAACPGRRRAAPVRSGSGRWRRAAPPRRPSRCGWTRRCRRTCSRSPTWPAPPPRGSRRPAARPRRRRRRPCRR